MPNTNNYLLMQKNHYDAVAVEWSIDNKNPVVGSYHEHNAFEDYNKYLFPNVETKNMIALEYGCGPGRNLIRFNDQFKRIDGVDIGEVNINNAVINIHDAELQQPNLYVNDGSNIPTDDQVYDSASSKPSYPE